MELQIPSIVLLCVMNCINGKSNAKAPNIVFIVADDLGYADIGYNNPFIQSPNIDELARSGIILDQSYVQPLCTPSRNAFLSGLYPFKTGLQHFVVQPQQPSCLPTEIKLLPQNLQEAGYATHMVGKWHLGFCNWNCTPTYRGFDSFYGFYNGREDYYTHQEQNYLDLRDNKEVIRTAENAYSTNLFGERAVDIISKHDQNQPLFLYLPFQAVHEPIQVPKEYEDRCYKIKDENRRKFCGMVSAMDEAVGNVTEELKKTGMYDNTIMIFISDNGGIPLFSGYNFPLRGAKSSIWEGGTRAVTFVHSPLLRKTGIISQEMIHAVDWFPTIISLAGGKMPSGIDGVDQTMMLLNGGRSLRNEFVYNLDNSSRFFSLDGYAGIRVGDFKLIIGGAGLNGGTWNIPPEFEQDTLFFKPSTVDKEKKLGDDDNCLLVRKRLFNLRDDPEERHNIAWHNPEVVKKLEKRLEYYQRQMVPVFFPPTDNAGNPENFGGVWSPGWC